MSDELQQRIDVLLDRLHTAYDGIGHSSGRPYVYFVYPPEQERTVQRMINELRLHVRVQLYTMNEQEFHTTELAFRDKETGEEEVVRVEV